MKITVEDLNMLREECEELKIQIDAALEKTKYFFDKVERMKGFEYDAFIEETLEKENFASNILKECMHNMNDYIKSTIEMFEIIEKEKMYMNEFK